LLKIRKASEVDAPLVASLVRSSFLEQVRSLGLSETEYPNYVGFETESSVSSRMLAGIHVALACRGDEGIGTISWRLRTNDATSGEIMRLAVLPLYRRNNYGHELMRYAETQLMATGALVAKLSIVAQFKRLQVYYEQQGYALAEVRRVPSLPFEVALMEKQLAD
jgi:N-acetylglutamate synthase-like GNAT family acetyltransferase